MTGPSEDIQAAQHQATGTIDATPPFDLAQSLAFLGDFAPLRDEGTMTPGALTKAVFIGEQPIVFQVTATGTIEEPRLRYTLHASAPIDAATERAATDRIAFFLSLADDLRPFYAIGQGDPAFAPVIARLYSYHQVKFLTPFENACWAILSQRNPTPIARRMKDALTDRFGAALTVAGATYRAFPVARSIAAAGPEETLAIVRNARRAEYLYAAAGAFAAADEGWLRTGPYDEIERWLRAIKGIGAWSAAFILLRGLGRMERTPLGAARLGEVVSRAYIGGRLASDEEIERLAEPYGPWRGYWAHYLRAAG